MGFLIDKYHLNLFCVCLSCKKYTVNTIAHSCSKYTKRDSIPPEIWNKENAECPYFEKK